MGRHGFIGFLVVLAAVVLQSGCGGSAPNTSINIDTTKIQQEQTKLMQESMQHMTGQAGGAGQSMPEQVSPEMKQQMESMQKNMPSMQFGPGGKPKP